MGRQRVHAGARSHQLDGARTERMRRCCPVHCLACESDHISVLVPDGPAGPVGPTQWRKGAALVETLTRPGLCKNSVILLGAAFRSRLCFAMCAGMVVTLHAQALKTCRIWVYNMQRFVGSFERGHGSASLCIT